MMNNEQLTITVSQVNAKIAQLLKKEKSLSDIQVKGEISNFTFHKTGHLYFTLKDESSSVKAVMFAQAAHGLKFKPENGMKVTVRGDIRVFERDGQYQLYAYEMLPEGMGALYLAFFELREKLEKEGLFSQKRPIPRNPGNIAVITAETGAALQDILNVISRRNPLVTVTVIPALVQGVNAPASVIAALQKAQITNAEIIIFGRGGGSIEDLQAFNDEKLARAVYDSKIPTISAVGHEIDFTIADFVADLRAPTPSAAAELSVPDIGEIYQSLDLLKADMRLRLNRAIAYNFERVTAMQREINAKSPSSKLADYSRQLSLYQTQLKTAIGNAISNKRQSLITEMKRIDALSPLNVLMRGYAITTAVRAGSARPLTDIADVNIGDKVNIRLHKGRITAKIEEKHA